MFIYYTIYLFIYIFYIKCIVINNYNTFYAHTHTSELSLLFWMPLITNNCLTAHTYIYMSVCVLFNYIFDNINKLYDSSNVHYINVTLLHSYTQQNILLTRIFSFSFWLADRAVRQLIGWLQPGVWEHRCGSLGGPRGRMKGFWPGPSALGPPRCILGRAGWGGVAAVFH